MRFGLDHGGQLPTAAYHGIGATFACRYLRELYADEVNRLIGGGVDVVLIHERLADAALGGYAYGVRDARDAIASANSLGCPAHVPVYFAVDFDEAPSQAAAVAAYMDGAASVIGRQRVGAYGGYWTISRLFDAQKIRWGWQTYAWSGGQFDQRCQLFQYSNDHVVDGVQVDYDHAYGTDFGQWTGTPPTPPTPPHGTAQALVTLDFDQGHWTIRPLPGKITLGSQRRDWTAEIAIGEQSGAWRIEGLTFDAPPLR
jgi:hypothetical protein